MNYFFNKIYIIVNNLYFYLSTNNIETKYKDTEEAILYTTSLVNNVYSVKKYNFLLYILRFHIHNIKNINNIIDLLQNITKHFFKFSSEVNTDDICNVIINCLNKYPLSEKELQKYSTIQQNYDNELGIRNYASTLFWLCCIQSVIEKNTPTDTDVLHL